MVILFVCTGNTCRSPMAEVLLKKHALNKNITGITVHSAGVSAGDMPANPKTVLAVSENDARLENLLNAHCSRQVTPKMISEADFIFAMGENHTTVLSQMGGDMKKIVSLSVGDPFGGPLADYQRVLAQLDIITGEIADKIAKGDMVFGE